MENKLEVKAGNENRNPLNMWKYISALQNLDCSAIQKAIGLIADCLNRGGKVFTAGNGGSWCIAQHFAADLRGPVIKDRVHYRESEARRVVHLGSNLAEFTALCNDVGYEHALSLLLRREGCTQGDFLVIFSVSGTSQNLSNAISDCASSLDCGLILISTSTPAAFAYLHHVTIETAPSGDNDWYGVIEGVFSCIAHEIANRVKERLNVPASGE